LTLSPADPETGPAVAPAVAPRRVMIFGDSHMASVRLALNARPARLVPHDVEFWGTVGHRFRHISLKGGAIVPDDDFTAKRFAVVNRMGRTELRPDDFDAVAFTGCRTRVDGLFMEFLHRNRHRDQFVSSGVQRAIIAGHLRSLYPYQFAMEFARQGKARILYAPVSFQLAGHPHPMTDMFPDAVEGTAKERAAIWALVRAVMAEDGIVLLAQPDGTVVDGCFTNPSYATRHAATGDSTHKNATYGALVLRQIRAELER
jgi:hypothetical protein